MKRLATILSILVFLLIAGVVYAAISWRTAPGDLTIKPGQAGFQFYNDQACTSPFMAAHWGEVNTGQVLTLDIYIKNTGTATSMAGFRILEDVSSWMTQSVTPVPQSINAGQAVKFTWTGTVTQSVTVLTPKSWTYELYTP